MRWVIACMVALVCVPAAAFAQQPEKKEPPAYKLNFKPAAGLPNGKVSTWKGTAKAAPGDRYFTENLLVLQPVTVTVVAKNKGDKIHVALGKFKWDEKHIEGTTGADGKVILKTRTQGDLRVVVTDPDGGASAKPYWLIVWVGDEHKPQLKPVTTSMKNYQAKSGGPMPGAPNVNATGGGSNTVAIVIAVVLGLGILILVLKLKKRGMT